MRSGRNAANRLNFVSVGVKDEGPVISGAVFGPKPRCAIVTRPSRQRGHMERIDRCRIFRGERHMTPARRVNFGIRSHDPEHHASAPRTGSVGKSDALLEHPGMTQGCKRGIVKFTAGRKVTDPD